MLHQIPSPARDSRAVLLAQPSWSFRKRTAIGPAATPRPTTSGAQMTLLPPVIEQPANVTPLRHRDAAAQALRQGGRMVTPVALVAAAVVLTASVDNVIRIALNFGAF